MIDTAWQWADSHNKLRQNEVHGEWEAKLILDDSFNYSDKRGRSTTNEKDLTVDEPVLQIRFYWLLYL